MSSATRVPQTATMTGEELTADEAWATPRAYGVWKLTRAAFARFRYGDGFSHSRALGLKLSLAVIPLVIAVVGLSSRLRTESVGRVLRQTLLSLSPGASDELFMDELSARAVEGDSAEVALWLRLLVAVVALTTAMGQVERGANRIYGISRDRPSPARSVPGGSHPRC